MLLCKTPSKNQKKLSVNASKYPPVYTYIYVYLSSTNL